jgi:phosphotransferase system HPr-like phosphotransfer protein
VLVLGIEKNHIVEIEIQGDDEEQAAIRLENFLKYNIIPS